MPQWLLRGVRLVASGLLAAAILGAIGGSAPLAWFRVFADWIRNPDDATPERYARILVVCRFYAVTCLVLAVAGLTWSRPLAAWVLQAGRELVAIRRMKPAWWTLVWFAGLVLVPGLVLRLRFLHGPANYDEAYSFLNYAQRPWYEAVSDYNSPNNHLLNSLLMHACYRVWGQQEWALRLPVLCAGMVLIVAAYVWARSWWPERVAWLVASFVACSPMLVTYSVDARGYSMVALAAVTMDTLLGRAAVRGQTPLAWIGAWLSMIFGFWAMPIMLYPAVGCGVAYGLAPLAGGASQRSEVWARARALVWFFGSGGWAVSFLYAPGYVFRGAVVSDNPVMSRLPVGRFFEKAPQAVGEVAGWWIQGPIPWPMWCAFFVLGIVGLRRARGSWTSPVRESGSPGSGEGSEPRVAQPVAFPISPGLRLACPLGTTLLIMAAQGVAPPPRVFLPLAPWFYLLVAVGVWEVSRRLFPRARVAEYALVAGLVAITAWYLSGRTVALARDESDACSSSVEPAMRELKAQLKATLDQPDRLLVPLPYDIPCEYYMLKLGFQVPVNGEPQPGDAIWLLSTLGRPPAVTLDNVLVRLGARKAELEPWREVRDYAGLTLWRSERPTPTSLHSTD